MSDLKRATKQEREQFRDLVLRTITRKEFAAIDAGEVLVAIGAQMMQGGGASEEEFTSYAKQAWDGQKPGLRAGRN